MGDIVLVIVSYGYILGLITISGLLKEAWGISGKTSRKILHAMIGNLVIVMPFFKNSWTPLLIAAPFILVTYLAAPQSPLPKIRKNLGKLSDLTEEGHHLGLILYSVSFTLLVILFPERPDVIATGIFPMAYGDSTAAYLGQRFGKIKTWNGKTLEGSIVMFTVTLISIYVFMELFFSFFIGNIIQNISHFVLVALVCTLVEALSPRGWDNFTVPILGALTFFMLSGGF